MAAKNGIAWPGYIPRSGYLPLGADDKQRHGKQSMQILFAFIGFCVWIVLMTWISTTIGAFFFGDRTLIVQALKVSDHAIEVRGRREGLIPFLLTLAGLSPTTSLNVNAREALCTSSGLFGISSRSLPLDRVPQVTYGSRKPVEYVFVAVTVGLVGFIVLLVALFQMEVMALLGVPVVAAIFAGVPIILYYINKRFFLGIHTQGGFPIVLSFKPNVIEGVELDLDRAMALAAVVRNLTILAHRAGEATVSATSGGTMTAAAPVPQSTSPVGSLLEDTVSPRELLVDAQQCIRAGRRDEAIATLRHIVRQFSESAEAEQARRSLEKAGLTP